MMKYAIGIDFGTLSGRAVLVELGSGREVASSEYAYPHAVMDEALPTGERLPADFALQHPQDYLDVLGQTVPAVLRESGISAEDVIGVGIDFTACTMLPVLGDGTPLCFLPEYERDPYAYIKLWKHHAAQDKATRLNEIAEESGEDWLRRYGGKISSEWMFPKIWETLDKAPHIYDRAACFVEAGDWVVWQLTGNQTKNACMAGYKGMWHKKNGFPSPEFFEKLDPRLKNVVADKFSCPVSPMGSKAGELTEKAAVLTGLKVGTAVAVANVDAHVAVPAFGIDSPEKMLIIIGTSSCHMLLGTDECEVPGICGYVEDGILPGLIGYEAGQSCCGDHFAWAVERLTPKAYTEEAAERGISVHTLLTEKAAKQRPGEHGLLALDWWNGNRSILVDVDLTGMMLGMTLQTKAEDIYRALLEATAYGTRVILENYAKHGVSVKEIYAAGGIAQKNPLMMQIYADVTGCPVRIGGTSQAPALGSAMFGAVAAGAARGGYDSIYEAAREMGKVSDLRYDPNPEHHRIYNAIFAEYMRLHDYFGRGENNVMKTLKQIKKGNLDV